MNGNQSIGLVSSGLASSGVGRVFARLAAVFAGVLLLASEAPAQIIGDPVDVSTEFMKLEQTYFVGARVAEFDPASGEGRLQWDRYERHPNLSFNKLDLAFGRAQSSEFPGTEYDRDPVLPFSITFVSPRTVRLRFSTRHVPIEAMRDGASLMLDGPVPADDSWQVEEADGVVTYRSAGGSVRLTREPWHIAFYDADGRLLTETQTLGQPASFAPYVPFSFIRRASDLGRNTAATFSLAHDEKIFGGGESFTRLDKRGQKMILYLRDAMGAQNWRQYKAVPFFLSSRGYGMFVHTSTPVTFDFGHEFDAHTTLYTGDELMDIFVFLGEPKDVLSEYTAVTGRSPVPPLWSFGMWMSRITYKSEAEVREVAAKLRERRIPTDVIHLDTGWFETDWQSNYEFSTSRFDDPADMIGDLREMGFHVSLWQLTYFTSKNKLWDEIVRNGYHVRNEGGVLPYEDAVLDFSNPEAVRWYKDKLRGLLDLGVSVIKADFGEDAPLHGLYASGRTGWYEHNLYPVRYNDVVYDVTEEVAGDGIIWGRSAWAGSQRYPLHWGGDAENTNAAMAASLRAGLSMGLSGFTYWSHDMGGFVEKAPRDLYRRWLPFGVLTSHSRAHGAPPREPWEYDEAFEADYRRALELKYALMPYIYAQSVAASERGHPVLRSLFFEYPDDPTAWLVEAQYLFGSDLLVAPLFEETDRRTVYLPPGRWIDYQTGRAYDGGRWHEIAAGEIPIVLLVKNNAAIPHVAPAQTTAEIDWQNVELRVFGTDRAPAAGLFALPGGALQTLRVSGGRVQDDPLRGQVNWRVTRAPVR